LRIREKLGKTTFPFTRCAGVALGRMHGEFVYMPLPAFSG
jgi:hypothetical protein